MQKQENKEISNNSIGLLDKFKKKYIWYPNYNILKMLNLIDFYGENASI